MHFLDKTLHQNQIPPQALGGIMLSAQGEPLLQWMESQIQNELQDVRHVIYHL